MARRAQPRPACPADSFPDEAALHELLNTSLDGYAFLGTLYKLTRAEVEAIDARRVGAKMTSFAGKSFALDFHNRIAQIAAGVGGQPGRVLSFARQNNGVLGSRPETVIEKVNLHKAVFVEHGLEAADAVNVVLSQQMLPHKTDKTADALKWLQDIVARGIVKPDSATNFYGTYFTTAMQDAAARSDMERIAVLHNELYGKPPVGLNRVPKSQRAAHILRMESNVALMKSRGAAPKARAPVIERQAIVRPAQPTSAVWHLTENAGEQFTLSYLNGSTASMQIPQSVGRLLRFMAVQHNLSGNNAEAAAASIGFSVEAMPMAVAQMISVVRDMEQREAERPRLLVGRFGQGTLRVAQAGLAFEKRSA